LLSSSTLKARIPIWTIPIPAESKAGFTGAKISIWLFACLARHASAAIAVFPGGATDTFAARLLRVDLAVWFLAC
jgi:hypothetical protein